MSKHAFVYPEQPIAETIRLWFGEREGDEEARARATYRKAASQPMGKSCIHLDEKDFLNADAFACASEDPKLKFTSLLGILKFLAIPGYPEINATNKGRIFDHLLGDGAYLGLWLIRKDRLMLENKNIRGAAADVTNRQKRYAERLKEEVGVFYAMFGKEKATRMILNEFFEAEKDKFRLLPETFKTHRKAATYRATSPLESSREKGGLSVGSDIAAIDPSEMHMMGASGSGSGSTPGMLAGAADDDLWGSFDPRGSDVEVIGAASSSTGPNTLADPELGSKLGVMDKVQDTAGPADFETTLPGTKKRVRGAPDSVSAEGLIFGQSYPPTNARGPIKRQIGVYQAVLDPEFSFASLNVSIERNASYTRKDETWMTMYALGSDLESASKEADAREKQMMEREDATDALAAQLDKKQKDLDQKERELQRWEGHLRYLQDQVDDLFSMPDGFCAEDYLKNPFEEPESEAVVTDVMAAGTMGKTGSESDGMERVMGPGPAVA